MSARRKIVKKQPDEEPKQTPSRPELEPAEFKQKPVDVERRDTLSVADAMRVPKKSKRKKRATSQLTRSASSLQSDVSTMRSVIAKLKKTELKPITTADVLSSKPPQPDNPELPEPKLLQRNKTVRWSGSRKAQGLIREFTQKGKNIRRSLSDPANAGTQVRRLLLGCRGGCGPFTFFVFSRF